MKWEDVQFDDNIIRINRTLNIVKDYDDAESKWHKEFGTPKTESSIRSIPLLPDKKRESMMKLKDMINI